jgi:YD repeat-containing protein
MTAVCKLSGRVFTQKSGAFFFAIMLTAAGLAADDVCAATAALILNHDNANRLIDATSANSGVQFNYDANGNVSTIAAASPVALTVGAAQTGQVSASASSALFSFTTTTGEPALSVDLVSANMSPAGSPVQVNVYNASGTLVGSITGGAGTLLNLPQLPAGAYSVSIEADKAATGSFQVELVNTPAGADAPLPLWSYLVLGAGLLAITIRRERAIRV